MLTELHIENIAVIESADISFEPGLNVLTGETGAGKSIVIDSINAVLGNRTSKELVRTGASSALVSAVFHSSAASLWLEQNDIECGDELILQRKISADGKSSCRVSGVPVTAAQLRDLATQLVDIHGQNDGLHLLDEKSHLGFLDGFGNYESYIEAYRTEYRKYVSIAKEIRALSMDDDEKVRLADSLRFRIDELDKAELKPGEYNELVSRRDILRNSEKLKEALDEALKYLSDNDDNALAFTQNAEFYAAKAALILDYLNSAVQSLRDASSNLSDASEALSDIRDSLGFSDEEYDYLESRIQILERLQKKYQTDEEGLIKELEDSKLRLEGIGNSADKILLLKKDLDEQRTVCKAAADALTNQRKLSAELLREKITSELRDLNMPSVRFDVSFEETEKFTSSGRDDVKFLMSANAGEDLGRISKIASGGELSRIMLALKNVFAANDSVGTLIFDEIDSGISGIAAQRVAEKLWSVSADKQVLVVSHLPQIAAMADTQFCVSKSESAGRTFTDVSKLDLHGRKQDIARLYGGDNITATTLAAAEEAIESSVKFKEDLR